MDTQTMTNYFQELEVFTEIQNELLIMCEEDLNLVFSIFCESESEIKMAVNEVLELQRQCDITRN